MGINRLYFDENNLLKIKKIFNSDFPSVQLNTFFDDMSCQEPLVNRPVAWYSCHKIDLWFLITPEYHLLLV